MFLRQMMMTNYQRMNLIVPGDGTRGGLWLGDYTAASDKKLLQSKDIKTVVTTASGLGISFLPGDNITHRQYNLLDIPSQNISHVFDSTFKDIDEGLNRGGVLVHCAAGISRSSTCLIAYLMRKNGTPLKETLDMVRSKRRVVCPNFGFERQLKSFEGTLGIQPLQKQRMNEVKNNQGPQQLMLSGNYKLEGIGASPQIGQQQRNIIQQNKGLAATKMRFNSRVGSGQAEMNMTLSKLQTGKGLEILGQNQNVVRSDNNNIAAAANMNLMGMTYLKNRGLLNQQQQINAVSHQMPQIVTYSAKNNRTVSRGLPHTLQQPQRRIQAQSQFSHQIQNGRKFMVKLS